MKWRYIRGWDGISYYSGHIGEPDCLWIHEHDGKWMVSSGVCFDELNYAKDWFVIDQTKDPLNE